MVRFFQFFLMWLRKFRRFWEDPRWEPVLALSKVKFRTFFKKTWIIKRLRTHPHVEDKKNQTAMLQQLPSYWYKGKSIQLTPTVESFSLNIETMWQTVGKVELNCEAAALFCSHFICLPGRCMLKIKIWKVLCWGWDAEATKMLIFLRRIPKTCTSIRPRTRFWEATNSVQALSKSAATTWGA